MDKIKIPKEVAEELQGRRNEGWSDFRIISIIYEGWQKACHTTPMTRFADQHSSPFLRALADGYEVEETPEDKVRYLYDNNGQKPHVAPWDHPENRRAYRRGITDTLESLDIKIEGVNT